eukprot:478600-Pelagomonas_calceolata.AAC.10
MFQATKLSYFVHSLINNYNLDSSSAWLELGKQDSGPNLCLCQVLAELKAGGLLEHRGQDCSNCIILVCRGAYSHRSLALARAFVQTYLEFRDWKG